MKRFLREFRHRKKRCSWTMLLLITIFFYCSIFLSPLLIKGRNLVADRTKYRRLLRGERRFTDQRSHITEMRRKVESFWTAKAKKKRPNYNFGWETKTQKFYETIEPVQYPMQFFPPPFSFGTEMYATSLSLCRLPRDTYISEEEQWTREKKI